MLAVIVPALSITATLERRARALAAHPAVREVALVHPRDVRCTLPVPEPGSGVRVLSAPLGRASQMNAGAAAVTSPRLLFLHADTRVRRSAIDALRLSCRRYPERSFAFSLGFDTRRRSYRVLETLARWRDGITPLPLGDQGLSVPLHRFLELGGFEDVPLFEDLRLLERLRRTGDLEVLRSSVWTSTARFDRDGVARTLGRNAGLLIAHALGGAPIDLARRYYGARYVERWLAADAARRRSQVFGVPRRREADA